MKCLNLNGCAGIKSLVPLSAFKLLEWLLIGESNSFYSLEPLKVCSLEPLKACTGLKQLGLQDLVSPVDLAPLAACPSLQLLSLGRPCLSMDLTPLQSCSHLEQLLITGPLFLAALRILAHLGNLTIKDKSGMPPHDDALL